MKRFILMALNLFLWAPNFLEAKDCWRDVMEFSEGICAKFVGLSGEESAMKYSGELNANLDGFLEKLADIGAEANVSIARAKYDNILREDVPEALRHGQVCRLEVAETFFDKICPNGSPSGYTVDSVDEDSVKNVVSRWEFARIEDSDGWTNVRSGPGMNYVVVTKIYEG